MDHAVHGGPLPRDRLPIQLGDTLTMAEDAEETERRGGGGLEGAAQIESGPCI